MGRHFLAGTPVKQGHGFHSETDGRPGRVHGGIPAADDQHPIPQFRWCPGGGEGQEIQAGDDAGQFFPGKPQPGGFPGPDPQKDGFISLAAQLGQRKILAQGLVAAEVYPQIGNAFYFLVQQIVGQSVFRYAIAQHAARLILGFKYRYLVAVPAEVISRREPSRSAADNGHLMSAGRRDFRFHIDALGPGVIGGKSFKGIDGQGFVHPVPSADVLAGMGADPPHHQGKGVSFLD